MLGVLVLSCSGVLFVARGQTESAHIDPAFVTTVSRHSLQLEVLETGKIVPLEKVELKSKVAGQVAKVLVEQGAKVKRGETLLVLDATDLKTEVERASAEVLVHDTHVELADLTLSRTKAGVEGGVIAGKEMDAAKHDVRFQAASRRLARAALRSAQEKLKDTVLVSPIDGTVIERNIEPGEMVTPGVQSTFDGKPLLLVADLSKLIVKVDLNQIDVARVALDQKATLTLDALPGDSFEARVTRIAPASVKPAGKDIEVFPVELLIDKPGSRMKPGMSADVRISLETKKDVLALPLEAIRKEQGKAYVTRIETDAAGKPRKEKVEVTIGIRNDREVEILSGIEEGNRIFIDPASASANETAL